MSKETFDVYEGSFSYGYVSARFINCLWEEDGAIVGVLGNKDRIEFPKNPHYIRSGEQDEDLSSYLVDLVDKETEIPFLEEVYWVQIKRMVNTKITSSKLPFRPYSHLDYKRTSCKIDSRTEPGDN